MPSPHGSIRQLVATTLLCLGLGCLTTTPLRATSVVPPTLEQLVGQSEYIVRAVVKSVTPEWQQAGQNRHIVTKVELEVLEVIAGTPPTPLVLSMLGGKIGDDQLLVDGAPVFQVGEEHIVFVRTGAKKLFPLVAMMHGQYPIVRDAKTGEAHVARSNGAPLYSAQDVAAPLSKAGVLAVRVAGAVPLTPEAFAGKIRAAAQATQRP